VGRTSTTESTETTATATKATIQLHERPPTSIQQHPSTNGPLPYQSPLQSTIIPEQRLLQHHSNRLQPSGRRPSTTRLRPQTTQRTLLQLRQARTLRQRLPKWNISQHQLPRHCQRRHAERTPTEHHPTTRCKSTGGRNRCTIQRRPGLSDRSDGIVTGFSTCLIRSALIKRTQTSNVFISNRKSMTIRTFLHTRSKRAEAIALLDSGATENFMNLDYAKYLQVPIQRLKEPRKLFNVDGTLNKNGELLYFTDLQTQTGTQRNTLRFFLSNLGENKIILGYPWFAAFQPRIDWRRGWINHAQLPVILRTPDAKRARFLPRQINRPRDANPETIYVCAMIPEPRHTSENPNIPPHYWMFGRVFSEEASHEFPPSRPWDHAIELKPGTPAALPGKLIPLSQAELGELRKFVKEHLMRGTIRPSKSPYKSRFFYIKKKDGKLRPVQDYRPVNQWTIRNAYPLPLIPELIDRLSGCSLYTKFDIRWGYNNVRIREGDEWKAAFITNEGLFEPTVMFFGLTNSPATFQTMMNSIFANEIAEKWLTVYMDDMAIHTRCHPEETEEQHIERHRTYVKRILAKLMEHNLFLKPEKCSFEQPSIEFLGVRITQGQVQMDDIKIEKVRNWRHPTNVTEVRKFLGFTGYYRYFIKDYSKLA
jgi:Reverse transcriptase (RNA-dependent DNA polymerase)